MITKGCLFTLACLALGGCTPSLPNVVAFSAPSSSSPITSPSAMTYPATAFTQTELLAGVPYVDPTTSMGTTDGVSGKFAFTSAIEMDANYYYVADMGGHTIRRVSRLTAAIQTIAGVPGVSGSNDGVGSIAKFGMPSGMVLVGTKLYVSDLYYSCIRTVDISDANFTVATVLGQCGSPGDGDGNGTAALFDAPAGLLKVGGFLYVADWGSHLIRQVQLSNLQVVTIAGQSGVPGATDDIGLSAQFNNPMSMTYYHDPQDGDVLFIADESNNAIRKLVLANRSVTTVIGTIGVSGLTDGVGTAAVLDLPVGIVTDGENLYIAESGSYAIRKVSLSDYTVTTLLAGTGPYHIDVFGTTLANSNVCGLTSLYFDSIVGLIVGSESALFRLK